MAKLGFIGSGNMAQALMKAIIDKGITNANYFLASDINDETLERVKKLNIKTTKDNNELVAESDIIFLAVKPQVMEEVLKSIKHVVTEDKIICSIAAGIKIKFIEEILGDRKVVRIMPNTPCLVAEMAAGYSHNDKVTAEESEEVQRLLSAAGKAFKLDEEMLDAVTGLSGSGPAFVARLIQYFARAGKVNGLPEHISYELALKTFKGTAKLLEMYRLKPEDLVKLVSSPNGTTVAGREILEHSDLKDVIEKTVTRATERSRELGEKK